MRYRVRVEVEYFLHVSGSNAVTPAVGGFDFVTSTSCAASSPTASASPTPTTATSSCASCATPASPPSSRSSALATPSRSRRLTSSRDTAASPSRSPSCSAKISAPPRPPPTLSRCRAVGEVKREVRGGHARSLNTDSTRTPSGALPRPVVVWRVSLHGSGPRKPSSQERPQQDQAVAWVYPQKHNMRAARLGE